MEVNAEIRHAFKSIGTHLSQTTVIFLTANNTFAQMPINQSDTVKVFPITYESRQHTLTVAAAMQANATAHVPNTYHQIVIRK